MPIATYHGFRSEVLAGTSPKFGLMVVSADPTSLELAAFAGADFVMLDLEHALGVDVADALPAIRAADSVGIPTLVRVPSHDASAISRVLDFGAIGICVPHVRTATETAAIVAAAKYAPAGDRAMTPYSRASGLDVEGWSNVWRSANEETVVAVVVEDAQGLGNIEEIAAVPGLDILWVGVGDLSQSLGAESPNDQRVVDARMRGLTAARANGVASWATLASSVGVPREDRLQAVADQISVGFTFFAWLDVAIVRSAFREVVSLGQEWRDSQGSHDVGAYPSN